MRRIVLPDPEVDFECVTRRARLGAAERRPTRRSPRSTRASRRCTSIETRSGGSRRPALGSREAVEIALSKELTIQVAEGLGIPVPRSLAVSLAAELEAATAEIGFPCVLKPVTSWRRSTRAANVWRRSTSPMRSRRECSARRSCGRTHRSRAGARGGVRETIKLFRDKGKTVAAVAMLIDRTWPPLGGSSVMRRTITPPDDAIDMAERLVAEIGLDGYSEVEFRCDAGGRPLLMEINPRLSQSVELAVRAGVDFPRMQLEWARGGQIPRAPAARIGVRVAWLAGSCACSSGRSPARRRPSRCSARRRRDRVRLPHTSRSLRGPHYARPAAGARRPGVRRRRLGGASS